MCAVKVPGDDQGHEGRGGELFQEGLTGEGKAKVLVAHPSRYLVVEVAESSSLLVVMDFDG